MKTPRSFPEIEDALRTAGVSLPEVTEDFPWGHRALKVKGKAFVFVALERGTLSLSVKLPESATIALSMPFVEPTGYGLGRSGWCTASFDSPSQVPLPVLLFWLEESYRAVAPKRLAKLLPGGAVALEASVVKAADDSDRRTVTRRRKPK